LHWKGRNKIADLEKIIFNYRKHNGLLPKIIARHDEQIKENQYKKIQEEKDVKEDDENFLIFYEQEEKKKRGAT
jgi:hypothetical protein